MLMNWTIVIHGEHPSVCYFICHQSYCLSLGYGIFWQVPLRVCDVSYQGILGVELLGWT